MIRDAKGLSVLSIMWRDDDPSQQNILSWTDGDPSIHSHCMAKPDITTREDITKLITEFYDHVRKDELLAPVFSHVDWEHHTPVIIDFWCMVLLGDTAYRSNPFQKHLDLPIRREHFERWLLYFFRTVDENFSGGKAFEAKERAQNIATMFQHKLGLTQ